MFRIITFILLIVASSDALAANGNLPLPRFAALKSAEVNVRTGPGPRYQVKWLLVKKDMPVEIIAEFDQWRKIRDVGGDEGWVHKSMLYGKRFAVINSASSTEQRQTLYKSPDNLARPVLFAENTVIASLLTCKLSWCRVKIDGVKGWIEKKNLWGVYEAEEIE